MISFQYGTEHEEGQAVKSGEDTEKKERGETMQGMIHLYTGDGKGKTTAAVGLAVRALGAGLRVFMGQFIKDREYHEIALLRSLDGFTSELFGKGCFLQRPPGPADRQAAREGLEIASEILKSGDYGLVILDEVTFPLEYAFFTLEELLEALSSREMSTEVALTGRGAPQGLVDAADLVTEMREVKHYYQKGILARDGIER